MNVNKWIKRGLVFSASGLLLAACGSNGETIESTDNLTTKEEARYELDPTTPAWKLDTKEETTELTWYVNADWWNRDFGNDTVTKKIKEDLNVDITFITGDDTKLNTIFAGDDMPDVITLLDSNSVVAKQANTWAMPLEDLAEKYDPYFTEVASEETMNWFRLDNEEVYGYPNYSNTSKDYEEGLIPATTNFIIRKDVYEAVDGLDFSTPEGFVASLEKIKTEFPDLLPFGFNSIGTGTGSLAGPLQDFLGVPLANEDGTYYDRNLDEDYLTWIKTLNNAYQVDLISDDSFADDNVGFEEKVKAGQYATMFLDGNVQQSGNLQIWMGNNEDKEYIAIDGPQSTVGNEPTLNQSGISGWMASYITNENIDPAKTMQIFTYLLDEPGQILTNYGIEGETYQVNAEGKYELLPEIKEIQQTNADQFKQEYRIGEFIFFGHDRYKALSEDSFPESVKQLQEWGKGKLYPHFILERIDPDPATAEARSLTAINTNWANTLISMVRAQSDTEFDQALEGYKTFLDKNNWDAIQEIRSEKMMENIDKLGL